MRSTDYSDAPTEKDPSDTAARFETVQVRDPLDLVDNLKHHLRKIHQSQLPDLRQFKWEIHEIYCSWQSEAPPEEDPSEPAATQDTYLNEAW